MAKRFLGVVFTALTAAAGATGDDLSRGGSAEGAEKPPMAVAIMAIKVEGAGIPVWFAENVKQALLKDVAEMPDVYVARLSSRGDYWPTPGYVISGICHQMHEGIVLECEVVSVSDERVVARVGTVGMPADLMPMKDEIRRQVKLVLGQLVPSSATQGEAVVASSVLAPAATTQEAGPPPAVAEETSGAQYDRSSLRWAIENPDDFDRELDYWSRRSTVPARYGVLNYGGPFGQLGGYPYIRYPNSYVLVPGKVTKFPSQLPSYLNPPGTTTGR